MSFSIRFTSLAPFDSTSQTPSPVPSTDQRDTPPPNLDDWLVENFEDASHLKAPSPPPSVSFVSHPPLLDCTHLSWEPIGLEEQIPLSIPSPSADDFNTDSSAELSPIAQQASDINKCLTHLETASIDEGFLEDFPTLPSWKFQNLLENEKRVIKDYLDINRVVRERDFQSFCLKNFGKAVVAIPLSPYTGNCVLHTHDLDDPSIDQLRACLKGEISPTTLSTELQNLYFQVYPERSSSSTTTRDELCKKLLRYLEKRPITYEYLHKQGLSPYDSLSLPEIKKVNKVFQEKLVVTDQEVQKFCIHQFRKVITNQKLASIVGQVGRGLSFYVLRTGQVQPNESELQTLRKAKRGFRTLSSPSGRLKKLWKQISLQDTPQPRYSPHSLATCRERLKTSPLTPAFLREQTQLTPTLYSKLSKEEKQSIAQHLEPRGMLSHIELQHFCLEEFGKAVVSFKGLPAPSSKADPLARLYLLAMDLLRRETPLSNHFLERLIQDRYQEITELEPDEVRSLNQAFSKRKIIQDIDLQSYCIKHFKKLISVEKLQQGILNDLHFHILFTKTNKRSLSDSDLLLLMQAKRGDLSESLLSKELVEYAQQLKQQDPNNTFDFLADSTASFAIKFRKVFDRYCSQKGVTWLQQSTPKRWMTMPHKQRTEIRSFIKTQGLISGAVLQRAIFMTTGVYISKAQLLGKLFSNETCLISDIPPEKVKEVKQRHESKQPPLLKYLREAAYLKGRETSLNSEEVKKIKEEPSLLEMQIKIEDTLGKYFPTPKLKQLLLSHGFSKDQIHQLEANSYKPTRQKQTKSSRQLIDGLVINQKEPFMLDPDSLSSRLDWTDHKWGQDSYPKGAETIRWAQVNRSAKKELRRLFANLKILPAASFKQFFYEQTGFLISLKDIYQVVGPSIKVLFTPKSKYLTPEDCQAVRKKITSLQNIKLTAEQEEFFNEYIQRFTSKN